MIDERSLGLRSYNSIEFHLNTYRPIYANAFTFLGLDFASLYEDRRTFSQMKRISTYKIFLCICEESDFTKIATLINFYNAL